LFGLHASGSRRLAWAPPDVDDGAWLVAEAGQGSALTELLGTSEPQVQAQQLTCLAAETRRLLQTQPTVVRVSAPTKVFGDIHGKHRNEPFDGYLSSFDQRLPQLTSAFIDLGIH